MGRCMNINKNGYSPVFKVIISILVFGFLSGLLAAQHQVKHIGTEKQLFVDDELVDYADGVKWRVNQPRKAGPVLRPLPETEGPYLLTGSILQVEDAYWMYYGSITPSAWLARYWEGEVPGEARVMTRLAKSHDGIHWHRAQINRFDIGRGKENAIVIPSGYGTLFMDPHQTRGAPFWFIGNICENPWWEASEGAIHTLLDSEGEKVGGAMYLCYSKNGLTWQRIKTPILPIWCDTQNQAFYDPFIKKYVAYVRGRVDKLRSVHRSESEKLDQLPWKYEIKPGTAIGPGGYIDKMVYEEWPAVITYDSLDPAYTDIYTPNVHIYPYAESRTYLAFLPVYRRYKFHDSHGRDTRGKYKNDGPIEIQLAVSRDGIKWKRYHEPYIPLGRMDELDGGCLYMGVGMIRKGSEIYQYYTGSPWTHGSYRYQPELSNAVFRAVQRLDGFVSVNAGREGGEIVTHPIIFSGNRLQLNINCGAMGEAWVEILDNSGNPLPGFRMEDCVSVDRNGVDQEVWWKDGPDVSALSGKTIRLRIRMRSSKLFALKFVENRK